MTNRCSCKLVAVKGTTISEPNVSFPVATFVGPMKANAPCHNPFVHFGMTSVQPAWRMRVTLVHRDASGCHLVPRLVCKTVPCFLSDQIIVT